MRDWKRRGIDFVITFALLWVTLTLLEKVPQAKMIVKPFGG